MAFCARLELARGLHKIIFMTENKEFDARLVLVEKKVQLIAEKAQYPNLRTLSDEIDLRSLFAILWSAKWWILGVTSVCTLLGIIYAFSLPVLYLSKGVYAPAQKQNSVGGIASQYSGLAAMAGINLGTGEGGDINQALVLVASWPFLDEVISKYELKPLIAAVKGWDKERGITWDYDKIDPPEKKWKLKRAGDSFEPTSYEAYKKMNEFVNVSFDSKTSLVTIAVEHYSPRVAKEWVDLIALEINRHFQLRDMQSSQANIEFLEKKIQETSISEMQSVFFRMIESQIKTLMLAESGNQYLIKTIVEPKVAEVRSRPKRVIITVAAGMAGFFLSFSFFLMRGVGAQLSRDI
jgi:uncharacterized protein involved in exopolysaccharide biosynthesis